MRIEIRMMAESTADLRTRFAVLLALVALISSRVEAARNGNCEVYVNETESIPEVSWAVYYPLTSVAGNLNDAHPPDSEYYTFPKSENVKDVKSTHKFIDAVRNADDSITLNTRENFADYKKDLALSQRVEVPLDLTCETGDGQLMLLFYLDDSNMFPPEMSIDDIVGNAVEYTVTMPLANGYTLSNLKPITGIDYDYTTTNIEAQLIDDEIKALFRVEIKQNGGNWRNGFSVSLTTIKEISWAKPTSFDIEIKDHGTRDDPTIKTETVTVTVIPDVETSVFNPRFEEPIYTTTISSAEEVSPGNTLRVFGENDFSEGYSEELKYSLVDGGSHDGESAANYITAVPTDSGVEIKWKDDVEEEQLNTFLEKSFAILILTATNDKARLPAKTILHIALPGSNSGVSPTECPACPTECPTCPTECPTCPTECPTTEPDVELKFSEAWYNEEIPKGTNAGLLKTTIEVEGDFEVQYSLKKVSPNAPDGAVVINSISGKLELKSMLDFGLYVYDVIAEVPGKTRGEVKFSLLVYPTTVTCPDGTVNFLYAFQTKKVPEHSTDPVWLNDSPDLQDCVFTLESGEKYFEFKEDVLIPKKDALDREAEEFNKAEAPVVRVDIYKMCDDKAQITKKQSTSRNSWYDVINVVGYNPEQTTLAIVIEDINDNAPYFAVQSTVVGYPQEELASQIRLPALLVAEAKDDDIGKNAEILYSLNTQGQEKFEVNPKTGAVYPRSDVPAAEDNYEFAVIAKNHVPGVGQGTLQVRVRTLREEHLLELVVDNTLPEQLDELLAGVEEVVDYELHAVSVTVLPHSSSNGGGGDEGEDSGGEEDAERKQASRSRRSLRDEESPSTQMRVIVYAIKNGAPLPRDDYSSTLEETLQNTGWQSQVEAPVFGNGGGNTGGAGDSSNSGLLAAVIVLGVLLGLVLIAAGVVGYWFGIRPRTSDDDPEPDSIESSRSTSSSSNSSHSVIGIEQLTEDMLHKRDKGEDTEEKRINPNLNIPSDLELPRASLMLMDDRLRTSESSDDKKEYEDAPSEAGTLDTMNTFDTSSSFVLATGKPSPKKSVVTFNEDVDCIEINKIRL